MSPLPKVYVFVNGIRRDGDVISVALSEDGHELSGHWSSSISWAKHDMGVEGDWKHDKYREHYPDGFEVVWVDDPKAHEGCAKAIRLHGETQP